MICCLVVRGVTLCWRPPCGFRSVGGCVCSRPRSCACCPPWPWLGRRVVAGGGVSFRRFPFFRAVAALCCRGGWFWVSTSEGQGLGCGTPGVRDVLRRVVFVVGSVSASRIFSHFRWASCSLCELHLRERILHRIVEFRSPLRGALCQPAVQPHFVLAVRRGAAAEFRRACFRLSAECVRRDWNCVYRAELMKYPLSRYNFSFLWFSHFFSLGFAFLF